MKSHTTIIVAIILGMSAGLLIGLSVPNKSITLLHHSGNDSHKHDEALETAIDHQLEIEVAKDNQGSGYNLKINALNFDFSPEKVNKEHEEGEGHAHLYIDGKKITRVYSDQFYIPELRPGMRKIKVTLNANDHQALYYKGGPQEAEMTIMVD